MIERVTDVSQFVYHYTGASVALDHILKSRRIRLGSYTTTNDPKETKAWHFSVGTNEGRQLEPARASELSDWLTRQLKQRTKLLCFCTDTGALTGDTLRDIYSRGFSKPRMWAQYAGRHSGVCLVFDKRKLAALIQEQLGPEPLVISGPVQYVNRSVIPNLFVTSEYILNLDAFENDGPQVYVDRHIRTHFQRLFFEKMTDWRDECEWRWVVFASTEADIYIDFKDSLAGVMFGEETTDQVVNDIMRLTESWGLSFMGLKWKNHAPWYDFGNLRYVAGIKNSPWGQHLKGSGV